MGGRAVASVRRRIQIASSDDDDDDDDDSAASDSERVRGWRQVSLNCLFNCLCCSI